MAVPVEELVREATTTCEAAQEHKRQVKRHRRRARELTQKWEELRAKLREYGIELIVEKAQSTGGHSDDDERRFT